MDTRDKKSLELYQASKEGNVKEVKKLITEKIPLDLRYNDKYELDIKGYNALYRAAEQGHTEIVENLLCAGSDPNIPCSVYEETALHASVRCGFTGIVDLLLKFHADVNSEDTYGLKPIDCVDFDCENHSYVIKALKAAGAVQRIQNQQNILIKNYNLILTEFKKHNLLLSYDFLNEKGTCSGLSKVYVLYAHQNREEEFKFFIAFVNQFNHPNIRETIPELIFQYLLSKTGLRIKLKRDDLISYSFDKLMGFMQAVHCAQRAQGENFYRSIGASWDKNNITCSYTHQLAKHLMAVQILRQTSKKEKQFRFLVTFNHEMVIKISENKFFLFEPNQVNGEIEFKNEYELANLLKPVTEGNDRVNLEINDVSFGDENEELDDLLDQHIDTIERQTELNSLIIKYQKGSISRQDLAFNLYYHLSKVVKDFPLHSMKILLNQLSIYLKKNPVHADHLFILNFMKMKKEKQIRFEGELLFMACRSGNLKRVIQLTNLGVSLDIRDPKFKTPLHVAAMYGNLLITEFLVEQGACIQSSKFCINQVAFSPIMIAAQLGYFEIVRYLLAEIADSKILGIGNLMHASVRGGNKNVISLIKQQKQYNQEIQIKSHSVNDQPIAEQISKLLYAYSCPPFLSAPTQKGKRYLLAKIVSNKLKANPGWSADECKNYILKYFKENTNENMYVFSGILNKVDLLIHFNQGSINQVPKLSGSNS